MISCLTIQEKRSTISELQIKLMLIKKRRRLTKNIYFKIKDLIYLLYIFVKMYILADIE